VRLSLIVECVREIRVIQATHQDTAKGLSHDRDGGSPMRTQHRSLAVTFGTASHQVTCAIVGMLALCTPALGQSMASQPLASAMTREANQLVAAGAATRVNAAQSRPTRTPRKRLGKWAVIPGIFVGAFLGAAVDCSLTGCGPGSPNIPAGVGYGMLVGVVTTAFAPREVAGTFLGVGGGAFAGSLIGVTIEGDCRPDHPCDTGATIGASVGSIGGGVVGYRMSSQ
jgi:hypothetical protein